jgi:hypothetical protein
MEFFLASHCAFSAAELESLFGSLLLEAVVILKNFYWVEN